MMIEKKTAAIISAAMMELGGLAGGGFAGENCGRFACTASGSARPSSCATTFWTSTGTSRRSASASEPTSSKGSGHFCSSLLHAQEPLPMPTGSSSMQFSGGKESALRRYRSCATYRRSGALDAANALIAAETAKARPGAGRTRAGTGDRGAFVAGRATVDPGIVNRNE